MATQLTASLISVRDTEIKTVPNQNGNYGTRDRMGIGEPNNGDGEFRALIGWDLSSIPSDAYVVSAYMELTTCGDYSNKDIQKQVWRPLSDWGEYTIAWSVQPSLDGSMLGYWYQNASFGEGQKYGTLLTRTVVQGWVNGAVPNYGVMVKSEPNPNDDMGDYCTREFTTVGSRPKLTVTYYYPPDSTTMAAELIQQTKATLRANITSVNGDDATVRGFQYGLTQSAEHTISESGTFTPGQFTLTPTQLRSGTKYYFRAFATNAAGTRYGSWQSFNTISGGAVLFGML